MSTLVPNKFPTKPFTWTTQEGERILVTRMRTSHLFFAVRMIYNHTAPPTHQILGCKRYNGPQRWSVDYRRAAVGAMLRELKGRNDLSEWMRQQLWQMWRMSLEIGLIENADPSPQQVPNEAV